MEFALIAIVLVALLKKSDASAAARPKAAPPAEPLKRVTTEQANNAKEILGYTQAGVGVAVSALGAGLAIVKALGGGAAVAAGGTGGTAGVTGSASSAAASSSAAGSEAAGTAGGSAAGWAFVAPILAYVVVVVWLALVQLAGVSLIVNAQERNARQWGGKQGLIDGIAAGLMDEELRLFKQLLEGAGLQALTSVDQELELLKIVSIEGELTIDGRKLTPSERDRVLVNWWVACRYSASIRFRAKNLALYEFFKKTGFDDADIAAKGFALGDEEFSNNVRWYWYTHHVTSWGLKLDLSDGATTFWDMDYAEAQLGGSQVQTENDFLGKVQAYRTILNVGATWGISEADYAGETRDGYTASINRLVCGGQLRQGGRAGDNTFAKTWWLIDDRCGRAFCPLLFKSTPQGWLSVKGTFLDGTVISMGNDANDASMMVAMDAARRHLREQQG